MKSNTETDMNTFSITNHTDMKNRISLKYDKQRSSWSTYLNKQANEVHLVYYEHQAIIQHKLQQDLDLDWLNVRKGC